MNDATDDFVLSQILGKARYARAQDGYDDLRHELSNCAPDDAGGLFSLNRSGRSVRPEFARSDQAVAMHNVVRC